MSSNTTRLPCRDDTRTLQYLCSRLHDFSPVVEIVEKTRDGVNVFQNKSEAINLIVHFCNHSVDLRERDA
jgi:hypothetical protein